jgi:hypothetical protein
MEMPEPLTTEELNAFNLRCVVCSNDVPKNRATRHKDTCSPECYATLKQWRKYLQNTRQCRFCWRPCTERQRAEWKLWKQETGGLRVNRGRPPLTKENKLLAALTGVTLAPTWEEAVRIAEFALGKEVDTAPTESNSISADQATI